MPYQTKRLPFRTEHRVPSSTPLFPIGQTVATPGAIQLLLRHCANPLKPFIRHAAGDWGDVCVEDANANEQALIHGGRIMSVYHLKGEDASEAPHVVWLITEADRSCTTALLPSEY